VAPRVDDYVILSTVRSMDINLLIPGPGKTCTKPVLLYRFTLDVKYGSHYACLRTVLGVLRTTKSDAGGTRRSNHGCRPFNGTVVPSNMALPDREHIGAVRGQ